MVFEALIVFVLISLLDIVTTKRALELGGFELNSIARYIIHRIGVKGLFVFKYLGLLAIIVVAFIYGEKIVWLANMINALAVAWNSYVIAKILMRDYA